MRRTALALVTLVLALGVVAVGCGGEEEASPTPDTVTGTTTETTTDQTTTDTTETTETETTETETTETTDTEPSGEGDPDAGREVFLGASGCGTCHTLADAGTSGTVGPNLDEAKPSKELAIDRVTNGRGGMPSFKGQLSDAQIEAVATFVAENAGK